MTSRPRKRNPTGTADSEIPATLTEAVVLVKSRIDWATDRISNNVLDEVDAARIEATLDVLFDIAEDVVELAAGHPNRITRTTQKGPSMTISPTQTVARHLSTVDAEDA